MPVGKSLQFGKCVPTHETVYTILNFIKFEKRVLITSSQDMATRSTSGQMAFHIRETFPLVLNNKLLTQENCTCFVPELFESFLPTSVTGISAELKPRF